MKIRIASRESRLALWQANHVRDLLLQMPEISEVEIVGMTTRGDQILDRSLSKIGGKGLFIKELEVALIEGRADLAVHSGKDIPMELEREFELLGFMTREEPTDAFVSNNWASLTDLPQGAVVGSSSLRRQAQVLALRPDLQVKPLRGNLDTRLGKLDRGEYDAIVLATAGLKRMEMNQRIRSIIPTGQMLPAVGQGALGLEVLAGRPELRELLGRLIDPVATKLVSAEREISRALGGSCQVPIAGYAVLAGGDQMHLKGLVAGVSGSPVVFAEHTGPLDKPIENAVVVVESLKSQGAMKLVEQSIEH